MKENWEQIDDWCRVHEGGFVDHPQDPGGATNRGITQRVYDAYRRRVGEMTQSVRHIAEGEVDAIYHEQYWSPIRGDDLPSGVDYAVYDYAVNSGVSRAARELQRVLGVEADGVIGAITLGALNAASAEDVIEDLCQRRIAFMKRIKNRSTGERLWKHFGRGWQRRVMGESDGFQEGDIGVIDRAVMLARSERHIPAPVERDDNAHAKAEGEPTWIERVKGMAKSLTVRGSFAGAGGMAALPYLFQSPAVWVVGGLLLFAMGAIFYLTIKGEIEL